MDELELLREWKERAAAVLAALYDAGHDREELLNTYEKIEDEVALLLITAPPKYRRVT